MSARRRRAVPAERPGWLRYRIRWWLIRKRRKRAGATARAPKPGPGLKE